MFSSKMYDGADAPVDKEGIVQRHYQEKVTVMPSLVHTTMPHKLLLTSRFGIEHLVAPPACNLDTIDASYKKVHIDQLGYRTHFGKYVVARTIVEPFKVVAVHSVLEDEKGAAVRFSLYNFISPLLVHEDVSWALARGQKLVILEPCMKQSVSGITVIRCDNPSHIILLSDDHDFTRQLVWRGGGSGRPSSMACVKLAETHKERGNGYFRTAEYCQAAACYSKALAALESKVAQARALTVTVLSNRSETLLRIGQDHVALRDATAALNLDPSHGKSLLRSVRALLGLKMYAEAQVAVSAGLVDFPDGVAHAELVSYDKQLKRLQTPLECVTDDHLSVLLEASGKQEDGNVRLLCAGYSKPLRVKKSRFAQGRGTFAAVPIRQGEIVLLERASVIVFSSEVKKLASESNSENSSVASFRHDISEQSERQLSAERMELTWRATMLACWRPEVHSTIVDLAGLPFHRSKSDDRAAVCRYGDPTPLPVSIENVETICSRNALRPDSVHTIRDGLSEPTTFSRRHAAEKDTLRKFSPSNSQGVGLWRKAGLINHRCSPNCSQILIGDVLILTALQDIRQDEEITINYAPICDSYAQRQTTIERFGFKCVCKRCRREAAHRVKYDHSVEKFFRLEEAFAGKKTSSSALLSSALQLRKTVSSIAPSNKESLLLSSVLDLLLQIYIRRREPAEVVRTALAIELPLTCLEHSSHLLPVYQAVWHLLHACSALAAASKSLPDGDARKADLAGAARTNARGGLQLAQLLLGNCNALVQFVYGADVFERLLIAAGDDS